MFYPIKQGNKITVGEGFQCWLPPIPKDKTQIINWGLPQEEQFWNREPLPKWYIERSLEEEYKQTMDLELILAGKKKSSFFDPMCERYRRREWARRYWGVWFMNDGEPTYMTGNHYYYLQWAKFDHKINDGYPMYYEFSRDNFYVRQWCEENPKSLGYTMVASRGTGKSSEEIATITNRATMFHNHRVAIQGKHIDDIREKLIQAKLVPMFNSLPNFFKPQFSHGTDPKETLVFSRPSVKGKESKSILFGPDMELKSTIFAALPGEKVLDGDTLGDAYATETGKCLGPETKVILYNGNIKMAKDVSISDQLMGPDSKPRKIQEIKIGLDESFKIIPNKGWDTWTCSSGHKMVLVWGNKRGLNLNGKFYKAEDKVTITIDSYLKLSENKRRHLLLYKVPIEYPSKKTWIDPYLLGLWIGDGNKMNMSITNIDPEIISWLMQTFKDVARYVVPKNRTPSVRLKKFHGLLKLYNLKGNKHIPNDYLVNDRRSRLELLAGIIDTDGYSTIRGNQQTCEITQKNYRVAKDIHRLATELGFYCSINEKIATMRRKDNTMYRCVVYRMHIYGDVHEIPIKVDRKKFRKIDVHNYRRRNPLKCGFKVEPNGFSEYVGFVLDGDKQHLLGDCQVTHNTNPKTVADVHKRHGINLKTVFRNHIKTGLLREESTVEEMDEGGDECAKIWKESDPKILDGNGFTKSKIHRHFISALDTDTSTVPFEAYGKKYSPPCNKYGKVDRGLAGIKIQADLDSVKDDLKELSSRMRKSPRNVTEAFIKDQSKSIFNIQLTTGRLNQIRNQMAKKPYVKGNLYWIKDKFGPVWWERDDLAGRFNMSWLPEEFSQIKEPDKAKVLNNVYLEWGFDKKGASRQLITPKNYHLFRISTDPIKYSKTKDARASKAAIHAFRLYDHLADGGKPRELWSSHNFFFEYCERPEDPDTYLEDLAMLCIFLGTKVLPERNIPAVNQYFEQNGLERLLAYPSDFVQGIGLDVQLTSEDAGYASTPEVIDYYTRRIIPFINKDINRMPFDDTIEDWSNFDPANPTTSHLTVSSGFGLVHAEKVSNIETPVEGGISDWFDQYDNSGTNGTFVDR